MRFSLKNVVISNLVVVEDEFGLGYDILSEFFDLAFAQGLFELEVN